MFHKNKTCITYNVACQLLHNYQLKNSVIYLQKILRHIYLYICIYIRLVHESISVAVKLLTFQEAILCTESRKPICNEIRLKRRNDNKRKSAHKIGNILS